MPRANRFPSSVAERLARVGRIIRRLALVAITGGVAAVIAAAHGQNGDRVKVAILVALGIGLVVLLGTAAAVIAVVRSGSKEKESR